MRLFVLARRLPGWRREPWPDTPAQPACGDGDGGRVMPARPVPPRTRLSISCLASEWERIREVAARRGLSINDHVIRAGLSVALDPAPPDEPALVLILHEIQPEDFVAAWLMAPRAQWRAIRYALQSRYDHGLERELIEERDWALAVHQVLLDRAATADGLSTLRIRRVIPKVLRELAESVEQREEGGQAPE